MRIAAGIPASKCRSLAPPPAADSINESSSIGLPLSNTTAAGKSFQTSVKDFFHAATADFDKAKPGREVCGI
jgi:hypothetical protein